MLACNIDAKETVWYDRKAKDGMEKIGLKEKKHTTEHGIRVSLRAYVAIVPMAVVAVVLLLYALISSRLQYRHYLQEIQNDIQAECRTIAERLKQTGIHTNYGANVRAGIDDIALHYKGRVMVVDENYMIVCDSAYSNENSYIVQNDVISVMTGEKPEVSVTEKDYYYEYYPIGDTSVYGVIVVQASLDEIRAVTSFLSWDNILVCTVLLLFCCGQAILFSKGAVKGILSVNKRMEFAKDGHLHEKIPVRGFREIREITENYNDTITRLMVLDSTRQEFVSNVSHELKTPITSMKVLADSIVQNEEADLAMYKEFMKDIVGEIDRESQIITDLLTLVKMDKKTSEMNVDEVDIDALLEIIIKRVTPIAASRGINISYEKYRDVLADVDEIKLSLALTNIIENAVKYNTDNGWVQITLNADHKNFYIKVADSGVGIPEDCKDQVFERFYRVDKARSRDTGGTGLGLAITKKVILMHRGTIKLYSEYGEGTTFTVRIPLKQEEML